MSAVYLALVDHHHERAPASAGARQNLARVRGHHLVDIDQIVAENAADPLIPHVETFGRARHGGGQFVEIDAAHLQRRRH
jgi:hypothetical protein